jgi:hypothetical protein
MNAKQEGLEASVIVQQQDLCSHQVPQNNLHVRDGIVVVGFGAERKDEEQ